MIKSLNCSICSDEHYPRQDETVFFNKNGTLDTQLDQQNELF